MKAFVTGATGFVGSHLVEELVKMGFEVSVLVRKTSKRDFISTLDVNPVEGSLESLTVKEISDCDLFFHIAGITKAVRISDYYRVNRDGTKNVCELCERYGKRLKKLVILSSLAAEKNKSHYGRSKYEGDMIALSFSKKLPIVILRPGAIYGPRDTDFYQIFKVAKKIGILPHPGFKRKILNLVYVKDVVRAIILSAQKDLPSGEILLVGDERNYTWEEIRDILSEVLKRELTLLKFPKFLAYPPALLTQFASFITKKPYLLNLSRLPEFLEDNWGMDISETKKKINYKPSLTLKEGFHLTIKWYEEKGML
jgi:nucleoside-diphosphate-sugar epimerase